jgi:hypothetical protein
MLSNLGMENSFYHTSSSNTNRLLDRTVLYIWKVASVTGQLLFLRTECKTIKKLTVFLIALLICATEMQHFKNRKKKIKFWNCHPNHFAE